MGLEQAADLILTSVPPRSASLVVRSTGGGRKRHQDCPPDQNVRGTAFRDRRSQHRHTSGCVSGRHAHRALGRPGLSGSREAYRQTRHIGGKAQQAGASHQHCPKHLQRTGGSIRIKHVVLTTTPVCRKHCSAPRGRRRLDCLSPCRWHGLAAALELAAGVQGGFDWRRSARGSVRPCDWVATGLLQKTRRAAERSPVLNS
jgi:hypothetical protein